MKREICQPPAHRIQLLRAGLLDSHRLPSCFLSHATPHRRQCDAPVGKAVRLRALELVPVVVKSAPIVRAAPKPGPATHTAIRYRPRAFDESCPGYASLLFLFADRAHLIRRCADAKCGRLYPAERIDRKWCSDKCRIGKAVERFRATKRGKLLKRPRARAAMR